MLKRDLNVISTGQWQSGTLAWLGVASIIELNYWSSTAFLLRSALRCRKQRIPLTHRYTSYRVTHCFETTSLPAERESGAYSKDISVQDEPSGIGEVCHSVYLHALERLLVISVE